MSEEAAGRKYLRVGVVLELVSVLLICGSLYGAPVHLWRFLAAFGGMVGLATGAFMVGLVLGSRAIEEVMVQRFKDGDL